MKPDLISSVLRTINHWNGLPNDIVNAPSMSIFKSKLDELRSACMERYFLFILIIVISNSY